MTYVREAMAQLAKVDAKKAEDARRLDLLRVDAAVTGLMPKVKRGDPKAAVGLVKLLERRARLLGLDAPARSLVGGDPEAPSIQVEARRDGDLRDEVRALIAFYRKRQPLLIPNDGGNAEGGDVITTTHAG
jgi:hypothetical protein